MATMLRAYKDFNDHGYSKVIFLDSLIVANEVH